MKIIASILLLILATSASAGTEIGSIIKSALVQQKNAYLPWSFLAESGSPMNWETTGVENGKRVGSAVVSVGGFTPQVVSKSAQDAKWIISLSGNKFGISRVTLDSNEACFGASAISSNCISRLSNIDASLKKYGIASQVICRFGPGAAVSEVRRISLPNRPTAYLHSLVSEGSGGQSMQATVFFKSTDNASELEHSTAVCSILFASNYGMDSNLSIEYKRQLIGQ